jgi:hypothetical protein
VDSEDTSSSCACTNVYVLEDCMSATAPSVSQPSVMDEAQLVITEAALRFPVESDPVVLAEPILLPPPVSLRSPPVQYSTADCRLPSGMLHTKQSQVWLHRSLPLLAPQPFPPVVPPGLRLQASTALAPAPRWQRVPAAPISACVAGHPLQNCSGFAPGFSCVAPLQPPRRGVPTAVAGVVRYRAEQQLLQARKRHMPAHQHLALPGLPVHTIPTSPPALQRGRHHHLVHTCQPICPASSPRVPATACPTYTWPSGMSPSLFTTLVKHN